MLGYVDRWSAKPGESIRLMVSSAGDAPFEARFARIICGDPNPRGPGYREVAMPHPLAGTHPGLDQKTHLGSWARIPLLDLSGCARGLVLCATIWPTTPARGRQVVASWRGAGGALLSLEIDADGVVARMEDGSGATRVATGKVLVERAWYDVFLVIDPAAGTLSVGQRPREAHPGFADAGSASVALHAAPAPGVGRATIAALAAADAT
ncbi:MAG: N,N-dimethylformamidase, partial [Alphaproteobacteria bacterium]